MTINGLPLHDYIEEQKKKDACGESISNAANVHIGATTVITGGSVSIKRGGRTYTVKGDRIEKIGGIWYSDGVKVDWEALGGEYEERDVVSIVINGNVQSFVGRSGDVTVNGDVANLRTGSGDVACETASNVMTGSGDVHCKHITGMVTTSSGNVYQ